MNEIRSTHIAANLLRTALVVSGLFTDVIMYREAIILFYLATKALETKLIVLKENGDVICTQLLSLGYHFSPQYEQDIKCLCNGDYEAIVK